MRSMRIRTRLTAILLGAFAFAGAGAQAASASYKTADGLTVYLAVLPAAMIRGETEEHVADAHGELSRGRHVFHVMVAVFDAEAGRRLEGASIEARVAPLGLAPVVRELEKMVVAGAVTYGNYFTMRGDGLYRITITVGEQDRAEPVVMEFSYEHRTR